MIKSSDIPSPFKVFISILLAHGPIYAFFINNKQTPFFYILSLCLFVVDSFALAILAAIFKKPFAPMFGSVFDEAYWKQGFADRRRVRRNRRILMLIVLSLWAVAAYFLVQELLASHK